MRPSIHILYIFLLAALVAAGCKSPKNTGNTRKASAGSGGPLFASEADKMRFDALFFEGNKDKQLGRYDEAAQNFEQCLKITQKVGDVYYQLYLCYMEMRKQGAGIMLDKAIELSPKNVWYLEEKALLLKSLRKNAESAAIFIQLIELSPETAEYYDNAAEQLVLASKPLEAIAILDKMEVRFGLSEEVVRKKEDLYLYMNKPEKAIEEVQKLVNNVPGNTDYLGMLAELYVVIGKKDKALEYYKKILAVEPENGRAHFGLANIYRQEGDSANVINELKLAFKDKDVSLKDKINVILSMAPLGDNNLEYRKQVFELAEIAVEKHPDQPQSHAIYADLLFGDKQYAKAAEQYKTTLTLDNNNFKVWQQLLACYEEAGDYKNLHDESDKALELFPDRVVLYYYNANASYQQKNYKKAASTAQAGIDLGIGDNFVNMGLHTIAGDAYYQLREYLLCYASLESALAIDGNNAYVLNNYAYYLAQQQQQLEKALSMAKKAIELKPGEAAYLDTYGWVLYKSSLYEEALTYIEKALALSPTDGDILEHLGDVYYQLGNKDKAVEYWRKAKQNGNPSAQLDKKINEGKLSD